MISRNKFDFKQLELTHEGRKLIEKRGRQIIVNDLVFYVNDEFRAVEEVTCLYVPLGVNLDKSEEIEEELKQIKGTQEKLEFIEKHLEKIYDKIKQCVVDYKRNHNLED